jgi:hypothetical protein
MAKLIRYALATVFFAASVGCLALWWGSATDGHLLEAVKYEGDIIVITILKTDGLAFITLPDRANNSSPPRGWQHRVAQLSGTRLSVAENLVRDQGIFGRTGQSIYFPLWYPALVFALAGVAALRVRRHFSIRSALIAVSVVAALLGMVVAL